MLVLVPKQIKDVKGALAIRSTVRLFTYYPILDLVRELSDLWQIFLVENCQGVIKFESKSVGCPSLLSKTPNQIVNDCSQIMNGVSSAEANMSQGELPDLNLQINLNELPFALNLGNYFIRLLRKEGVAMRYEFIDAMPGPVKPTLGKLHISRLRGFHNREEKVSDNSEGSRNLDPEARRLL
jgi:hypothetical protein